MHPYSAGPRLALGRLLATGDKSDRPEAARLLHQAADLRARTYGDTHPLTVEARTALTELSH